jgi:hypothetical protein
MADWRKWTVLGVGAMVLSGWAIAQQPTLTTQEPADLSIAMRAKLAATQKVTEGLTAGNFELIRKGADELQSICDSRVWRPREDQIYSHYRSELHRSALKLAALADDHNLDAAAYGYMHTLTTCINCHQYSRDVLRVASGPGLRPSVVSIPVTEEQPRRNNSFR